MTWENRIVVEASSADPDSDTPVWVDLSSRVRDAVQPINLGTGRQNDLDTAEPSVFQVLFDTADDALTYGNTAGPYPWWGPGRRIRWREVVAGVNIPQFDGFISPNPTETVVTRGIEQRVLVTATDRLGRLQSAEPFISTLNAHVKYNGGPALVAHWPMNDASGATSAASLISGVGPLLQVTNYNDAPANNQLLWANRPGPVGDDVSYVQMNPTAAVIANNYQGRPRLARRDISVPMTAGTVVAFLMWIYIPVDATQPTGPGQVLVSHPNGLSNPTVQLRANIGTGWSFDYADAGHGLTTVTVPAVKTDSWTLVGAFMDVDASVMTLYVDGQTAAASLGAPAFTGTFQEIALDGLAGQSFGPVQIYSGNASQLNQAFFTAQYQMGLLGLERQTTGDRIRLLAGYAGIPASQLNNIDVGSSVMQRARLAGQTPLDAMRDAERTEQGLLYCDGNGNLVFKDRRTLYNI